ncbi:unnamed protein product [Parnassius mnemosyne]|uniref:Uncharacterized protein n=1 Tax=Parnassius mnemosyne TaxID=213953 RepID=A0AAV1KVG0_9NEOP
MKRIGLNFRTELLSVKLADGTIRNSEVLLTEANVQLASNIPMEFIILPNAVNNDTLLGINFITKARMIINFDKWNWRTVGQPRTFHALSWETRCEPVECAAALNVLREDEATALSESERSRLANLLGEYSDVFDVVGEPTPFAEQHIDTGDHPPIAVPSYQVTPAKKEIMRAELDKMLADGVIEECESLKYNVLTY